MESTSAIVMPGGWMLMLWLILQAVTVFALAQSSWWISARLRIPDSAAERALAALLILLGMFTLIPTVWGLVGIDRRPVPAGPTFDRPPSG